MNTLMLLEMAAEAFGDREAIRCNDQALSYTQLYGAAREVGERFRASRCESVAWLDSAGLCTPVALFGAAAAGLPYVPLNYRLTDGELGSMLQRLPKPFLLTADASIQPSYTCEEPQELLRLALKQSPHKPSPPPTAPVTPAVQLFTSGTTGKPKAAVLRHSHLMSYILGSVEFAGAGEDEAVLVSVPPYHIAGIAALLSATYAGRRVVLMPAFDAASWLSLAQEERVTHAFLVPTMLARVVEELQRLQADNARLPALRALAYGGGKMPASIIEKALSLFPSVGFTNAYGLTETSSTITVLGPEDHRQAAAAQDKRTRQRLASVGRPLPGIDLQIRDSAGQPAPPGEVGEVYVRGEQVAGEYLDQGSQLDGDAWFPTRDAGYLDDEGFLYLEGRADDVIVRGGENISPGEVEAALESHPGVLEAAVVGIPSEEWGEVVAAAVVPQPGLSLVAESLRDHVRLSLRSSRVPVEIRFLNQLPYNEMGKLLRRQIRAVMLDDSKRDHQQSA